MISIPCKEYLYEIIQSLSIQVTPYPYLVSNNGNKIVHCIGARHGRSFVVGKQADGRYIVSKGNGLSYSEHPFLYTPEMPTDVWGLLLKEDALRDFYCGQDVQALGIKTNQMECVLELDYPIYIPQTDKHLKPVLLQYSVECPYRIADACFMSRKRIWDEVQKWERLNEKGYEKDYQIAAEVLIRNLHIMHTHGVLHNALTYENLTWALELLDFEICHTPQHPYEKEDYVRHVPTLFDREIIDIYKIINYIAGVLREPVDYHFVDTLFEEYGYDLSRLAVK